MKTPMQELIEWNDMYRPLNHPNGTEVLMLKLKQMLEKEKGMMCQFAFDYQDEYHNNGKVPPIKDYYNETFNTKEI